VREAPPADHSRPFAPPFYDAYRSIARTGPLAVLVRAKLYRIKTSKEAWLDYDRIFKVLREARYNGFVSLVYEGWLSSSRSQTVRQAAAAKRRNFRSLARPLASGNSSIFAGWSERAHSSGVMVLPSPPATGARCWPSRPAAPGSAAGRTRP
jgi:hypothetical protein